MLHFVTSYMKQNKSRKQTLESAQYGLEISFKYFYATMPNEKPLTRDDIFVTNKVSSFLLFYTVFRKVN